MAISKNLSSGGSSEAGAGFNYSAYMKKAGMIFNPETSKYYDVQTAGEEGFICDNQGNGITFGAQNNTTIFTNYGNIPKIVKYSGFDRIKVPAGTSVMGIQIVNNTWTSFNPTYTDTNTDLGTYSGGYNYMNTMVSPQGTNTGVRSAMTSWVTFPVIKSDQDRFIQLVRPGGRTDDNNWFINGIAYQDYNYWGYTNIHAFGLAYYDSDDKLSWFGDWQDGVMAKFNANADFIVSVPAVPEMDNPVLYIQTRSENNDNDPEHVFSKLEIWDWETDTWVEYTEVTGNAGFTPQYNNVVSNMFSEDAYSGYVGLYIPRSYLSFNVENGISIPTKQKIRLTVPAGGGSFYARSMGFNNLGVIAKYI